ncbi:MAG: hypothetical protein K0A89_05780 [ANME-2 cluster archaeon]|nr:hypothetical protein [ANME-2 cluster archaeon]
MRTLTVFSNIKNAKIAAEELIEKAMASLTFEPDLVLFYATLKYNGHYQEMLDVFQKRFGDIPQIGASVDGMIFPNDIRTDGAALVLCEDKDALINVTSSKKKGAINSAEKLAAQIKCEKGVVILHFPLVHVPGLKKTGEFFAKGRYYSYKAYRGDENTQQEMARNLSDYCNQENIFYLPPTVLEIFARKLDYKVPIVGMNLLHTQVKFNSPSIFSNFKDIGGGIAALVIEKDNVEVVYDDIFPNKGATMEETIEKIKERFSVVNEFDALFKKNVLISLSGKPPLKAVKNIINLLEKNDSELKNEFDKGKFQVQNPYILIFFNKKTNGIQSVGLNAYFPFDLFPFFLDLTEYSNKVLLTHEPIYINLNDYISSLYHLNNLEHFAFFIIDVGSISAFGDRIISYNDEINNLFNEYFGIISASPSIFLPDRYKKREYIAESDENIYYISGGGNIFTTI